MEEFVEGHEGFYDTITINGQVALDFASHYYPNVLEAMRTWWVSAAVSSLPTGSTLRRSTPSCARWALRC